MESEMNSYESETKSSSESESELNQRGTRAFDGSGSDSGSNSRLKGDGKRKKSKNQQPNPTTSKRYQHMSELRKNMREALRRDLFWNLERLPQEDQLDIEKTFESQKDLVIKKVIPNLMKTLDLNTYPIGEGVVYEMVHQRHHHQRENLRNKNKPEDEKKRMARQKHVNSRRLEKRRKRSKTIVNLKELKDPLIEKFKDEELLPIVSDNGYHSPEFSEDGDEQNIIVVRNLRWRSSTLRRFLYYVDKNTKKGIKKRERVYKPSEYVDETAPSDAPSWTKSGYDSSLKRPVAKAVSKYITQ